jgi:CheY-specific phosphatase CheX
MSNDETDSLVRRYGLEPIPQSVIRLTRLISNQNADAEAIAAVITQDRMLAERLLRMTRQEGEDEQPADQAAVEMALMRSGLGLVFLLAMGDPLMRALIKTFSVMLAIQIDLASPKDVAPIQSQHMLCEVDFRGKAAGKIQLRLTEEAGRLLASRMLGLPAGTLCAPGDKDDAIIELVNMVAGNFLSNLNDAGLPCQLTAPRIYRTSEFTIRSIPHGVCERLAFRSPEAKLFLDISVNPWND